ncbi:bifunctional arginine demethylase and lysyl-hydroxylase JMJD6-like, partial [Oppia nitens]|uniref:bifunctional arginine demethylase and lysyl-hydroxylase JMJD6-like n=1 Tax=Oppia nitens TaxID=1686743 RepID=UPI0023DBCD85
IITYLSNIYTVQTFTKLWFWLYSISDPKSIYCTIAMPGGLQNAFMPQFDCNICANLKNISKVFNITQQEFTERYAYSGVPVVIMDAMTNWTATHIFSFEYFKEIYPDDSPALDNYERNCQFFPYKTNFTSLRQVLNMGTERAQLLTGTEPWYIGWSNCDPLVSNILRQHYRRPYFMPQDSEGTKMDWIFMGSPNYGAHMHIDHVGHPSWQSQVRGSKKWILEPPPECYTICQVLEVIVNSGEIIVLDTNQWYHQTLIVGQDISITIGSEFD